MNVKQKKVTYFTGGKTSVHPVRTISLEEVFYLFTKDKNNESIINEVRQLQQQGQYEEALALKSKLSYITVAGQFSYRNNESLDLSSYNWIVPIDIDGDKNPDKDEQDWNDLFQTIIEDECTMLCVRSPRGVGIKALLLLKEGLYDPKNQYEVFKNIVYPYYEHRWSCKLDYQQGALSQPFYFTFDKGGYVNEDPEEMTFDYSVSEVDSLVDPAMAEEHTLDEATKSVNELQMFCKLLVDRKEGKYEYFGKVCLFVGGLFSGRCFHKDLREAVVVKLLVDAGMSNKYVVDKTVCKKRIEQSFAAGKSKPITRKELEVKRNISTMLKRISSMNDFDLDIVRIGNDYFENITKPDKFGVKQKELFYTSRQCLVDDYGIEYLERIPKYKTFCNVPDNINHRKKINGCYNLYSEFTHVAVKGAFPTIEILFKHIFGDQCAMGYDYIQLLYSNPNQILPILCLVSKENSTGKTTFLDFLCKFFKNNAVIVSTADIEGSFNSHYASKLIIAVDESELHKETTSSKLKQWSTSKKMMMNGKFQNQVEIDFFGKFILASNKERNFINVKEEDVRYWVRKISKINLYDPLFEEKLVREIPQFLYFLQNRKLNTPIKQTRHWFKDEDICTVWLNEAKRQNASTLYHELNEKFINYFGEHPDVFEINCTATDIQNYFLDNNREYSVKYIANVMKDEFKVNPRQERKLSTFSDKIGGVIKNIPNGWFYKIDRKFIMDLNEFNDDPPTKTDISESGEDVVDVVTILKEKMWMTPSLLNVDTVSTTVDKGFEDW